MNIEQERQASALFQQIEYAVLNKVHTGDSAQLDEAKAALARALAPAPAGEPLTMAEKFDVDPAWADLPTPKPQEGVWTLTAPDGRMWAGESPLRVCSMESKERVPAHVALARIARGCDEPVAPTQLATRDAQWMREAKRLLDEYSLDHSDYIGALRNGDWAVNIEVHKNAAVKSKNALLAHLAQPNKDLP